MEHCELEREVTLLYEEYAAGLLRYAGGLVRVPDEANDAVQEVFLRYFMERRYGREIQNVRAWLYQVLRNHLINGRKAARNREVAGSDLERIPTLERTPEAIVAWKQMVKEIGALLTGRERECLELRSEGLSYGEIGARLDIRPGTVGALLSRVYRKCSVPLGRSGDVIRYLPLEGTTHSS